MNTLTPKEISLARTQFRSHKHNAKIRNIEFNFTFEEWITFWLDSGHYKERGCTKGKYCMSRYGDTGPYELGNVFIQPHSKNTIDSWQGRKMPSSAKIKLKKIAVDRPTIICPYCNKIGKGPTMYKWHLDNCKLNTDILKVVK